VTSCTRASGHEILYWPPPASLSPVGRPEQLLGKGVAQYYRKRHDRVASGRGHKFPRRRVQFDTHWPTVAIRCAFGWSVLAKRARMRSITMAANRSVTMRDVAVLANVSTATVSHVINGTRFVSDDIKRRVSDAIAQTGYVSNILARSLRVGETHTIGHVVTDIENPFFAEIARAVQMNALRHGYVTIIANSDEDPATERLCIETLIERRIDGLVIAPCGGSVNKSCFARLAAAKIPTVLVNRDIRQAKIPLVTVDYRRGAYDATKVLLENGYNRIGVVAGPHSVSSTTERLSGYAHALQERGLARDPSLIFHGKGKVEDGYNAGKRLLRLARRPAALLVFNSSMMTGLLAAMNELGLTTSDVPAVVFQGRVFDAVLPDVWSVQQPTEELGIIAFDLLFTMMQGNLSNDGTSLRNGGGNTRPRVTAIRAKLFDPKVPSPDGRSKDLLPRGTASCLPHPENLHRAPTGTRG